MNYNTDSYITDDNESHSIISQPFGDDDSILNETDDDPIYDDDQTEGSATPTTQSKRSTVSEVLTEFEDRPTATSTSRLQSGGSMSTYTRRTSSSSDNNE